MFNGKVIQDVAVEEALNQVVANEAAALAPITGAIQDLQYKNPAAPETAGVYVLQATVAADGSVTYAYVAA